MNSGLLGEIIFFRFSNSRGKTEYTFGKVVYIAESQKGDPVITVMDLFSGHLIMNHKIFDIRMTVTTKSSDLDIKMVRTRDFKWYVIVDQNDLPHNVKDHATNATYHRDKFFFHGLSTESREEFFEIIKKVGTEEEKMSAIYSLEK
jgi:hypothetical protein